LAVVRRRSKVVFFEKSLSETPFCQLERQRYGFLEPKERKIEYLPD
jgi:hypothetical protein